MKKVAMMCLVAVLGGCGSDNVVCSTYKNVASKLWFDAVSLVHWPSVDKPSSDTLYATLPAGGEWVMMADGCLACVFLDDQLFTVSGTELVYARMLVVNTTHHEIGVLLHADDVVFSGQYVLPSPAGAKLAVSEEEFAAGRATQGSLPEQQVGAAIADQARRGVLVTIPPYASLEVYRLQPEIRRGELGAEEAVTVLGAPGMVATDGRCFERLGEAAAMDISTLAANVAWPQVPLGSLTMSDQGPARLVPSKQPNLTRPVSDAMPSGGPRAE